MKIKQRKYVSEKEALYWLIDNSETLLGIEFEINAYGDEFFVCDFRYDERLGKTEDGSYYINEEVEITEDTKFNGLIVTRKGLGKYYDYHVAMDASINSVKRFCEDILFINIQNDDGSIGELIWSKECRLHE
ncbi:hypothetical protein [Macrococcus sp. DPC7161]|uniref:hypothetical protein n=1 Tax=Macrococcus sp. DPC7161 TaxID=2507060 RepID=UPI00100B2BAA|nr:hypothetical protein [Macrococcus sp. DPC7161]RXK19073.1 hypothetical protein ER639_01800 [Macrococcus sp. DPC7161]